MTFDAMEQYPYPLSIAHYTSGHDVDSFDSENSPSPPIPQGGRGGLFQAIHVAVKLDPAVWLSSLADSDASSWMGRRASDEEGQVELLAAHCSHYVYGGKPDRVDCVSDAMEVLTPVNWDTELRIYWSSG